MKIGSVDTAASVALVAEVGNNHEGSVTRAEELIESAFHAGADAVKLQTFVPELYVSRAQPERLEMLRRFALPEDDLQRILLDFGARGLPVFSTPFDLVSLQHLGSAPLLKISSGDITFSQLLTGAALSRKDIIISTGASTMLEVEWAVDLIRSKWAEIGHHGSIAALHCVSAYPAPADSLNLRAIATLRASLPGVVIGYSDHALGIDAALTAVAVGARIIEKHFTLDKNFSTFRDHQLSADPREFAMLRSRIAELQDMLGTGEKVPQAPEREARTAIRRSIAVTRTLPVGHRLEPEDLCVVRPGTGLAPSRLSELVGRVLGRQLSAGDPLEESDIQ